MVGNLMDVVKGTGGSKVSQAQKSKKSSSKDKPDFGQALTDAAGAANAQAECQTYDEKETSVAEKGAESVQAAQNNPEQQIMSGQESVEEQDALMSLLQMGAEGKTADAAYIGQSRAGMAQNAEETQMADIAQTAGAGKIPVDSLQSISQTGEVLEMPEEMLSSVPAANGQMDSEMSKQMMSEDTEKKAADFESVQDDENSVIDVKAEAASDKASTSFLQFQNVNGSKAVETQVEVTETGEIKPEYANMLKDMIAKQISNGRQEFEIALTPKNLGALLVKVAVEAGETTVSIICSNARTMEAMSSKATELGRMLETTLGDKMEVVVEDKNGQESNFYEDGRNGSGAQAQKEEQERKHEENRRRMELEAGSVDFLQQLRLGLA
ncbi:MAG: hypothetical protein HFH04_10145 [Dorea sp.]|nr:hypothetical protein [Dorea sp.]